MRPPVPLRRIKLAHISLRLNVAAAIAWFCATKAQMAFRDPVNATSGFLRLLQGSVR